MFSTINRSVEQETPYRAKELEKTTQRKDRKNRKIPINDQECKQKQRQKIRSQTMQSEMRIF